VKIDFYSRDNCPFDPMRLWDQGLGGAEYALVFLAEELGRMGHEVTVWNDHGPGVIRYGEVTYRSIRGVDPDAIATDAFVIFRVSIPTRPAQAKRVAFFSCDQVTDNQWARMWPWLDRFICISPYHAQYVTRTHGLDPALLAVCELGVSIPDYEGDPLREKVEGTMIFCSVPHRGLGQLLRLWPQILERVPYAELVVTSDYRLWGRSGNPGNQEFRERAARLPNVQFLGKVPRAALVEVQRSAEILAYPCVYDENFGISVMECIAAGAVPVTTDIGALATTVGDSGLIVRSGIDTPQGASEFVEAVAYLASHREDRLALARRGIERARHDYSYAAVAARFLSALGPLE
jgi:glycosyltransferase involved in cell wall biosynthesis